MPLIFILRFVDKKNGVTIKGIANNTLISAAETGRLICPAPGKDHNFAA